MSTAYFLLSFFMHLFFSCVSISLDIASHFSLRSMIFFFQVSSSIDDDPVYGDDDELFLWNS